MKIIIAFLRHMVFCSVGGVGGCLVALVLLEHPSPGEYLRGVLMGLGVGGLVTAGVTLLLLNRLRRIVEAAVKKDQDEWQARVDYIFSGTRGPR